MIRTDAPLPAPVPRKTLNSIYRFNDPHVCFRGPCGGSQGPSGGPEPLAAGAFDYEPPEGTAGQLVMFPYVSVSNGDVLMPTVSVSAPSAPLALTKETDCS